MKICIFGAGAIGAHIGGHLARVPGVDVSLVARGPHRAAIENHGLRIITEAEDFTAPVSVTEDPSGLGQQDYVFVTLKSHQVPAQIANIASLLGNNTAIVPPTTGIPYWYFHKLAGRFENHRLSAVDPDDAQWRAFGPERALGCAFWTGAEVVEPGVVRQDGARSGYPLGEPDGTHSARVTALSQAMADGGLRAPVRRDIRGEIWMKMINSLVWNQVAFLTTANNGEIARSPAVVALIRKLIAEAEAVATALGATIPVPAEKRLAMTLGAVDHRMSMLQDLQRGRRIEIDAVADSIGAMSELTGVATPTIDALVPLTKLRAEMAGLYPPGRERAGPAHD